MTCHYPDLDSDTSSVWNFCSRSSEVISQETSGSVGKISTVFSLPKTWGEREKVILAVKIIVAGLKSREIHSDKNVINSLQPVITITQRKDIIVHFYKHIFEKRKLILNQLIFFSIFYLHFKGPVLVFPLSGTQIFHGQSGIWGQD